MQTYSHFVMTLLINRRLKNHPNETIKKLPPVRTGALLLGSFLPDLPLIAMALTTIGVDISTGAFEGASDAEIRMTSLTGRLFDDWFFNNPWVIAPHNFFHSPVVNICLIGLGFWLWKRGVKWGSWVFWLACATMLHTLIDIPIHADDGPLLLFPFNWTFRFYSPVSYWDPRYYGTEFAIFEHLLLVGMLVAVAVPAAQGVIRWFKDRRQATAS